MTTPLVAAKQQLRTVMKKRLAAVSHESVTAQSKASTHRPASDAPTG